MQKALPFCERCSVRVTSTASCSEYIHIARANLPKRPQLVRWVFDSEAEVIHWPAATTSQGGAVFRRAEVEGGGTRWILSINWPRAVSTTSRMVRWKCFIRGLL
jgi:hypothetical protein